MNYCCQRILTTGSQLSWIRPHVCRLPTGHHEPHQCTCLYEWETQLEEKTA